MSETTFENARTGDVLWLYTTCANGTVSVVGINPTDEYPVKTTNGSYTFSGQYLKGGPQVLFWSKPQIIAPPRPKRWVKKVVEVRPFKDSWGNIDAAIKKHFDNPCLNWCGPIQQIEVEVEE